jgi:hypothetical protein
MTNTNNEISELKIEELDAIVGSVNWGRSICRANDGGGAAVNPAAGIIGLSIIGAVVVARTIF